jgi:hypothetical protein
MTLHKITDFCTEWFIVCPNITSKFRTFTTAYLQASSNKIMTQTYSYVHNLLLLETSFTLSTTVQELPP